MKRNKKIIGQMAICSAVVLGTAAFEPLFADPINLTQVSAVKAAGTYTYYALGNGSGNVTAFTTKFYPAGPNHYNNTDNKPTYGEDNALEDNGSNATPVSFASGFLTNNNPTDHVGGWYKTTGTLGTQAGYFNVLFDLGAVYDITSVVITYSDSSGYRWISNTDYQHQQVLTATSLTPSGNADALNSDFTPYAAGTFQNNQTQLPVTFTNGTDTMARYVLLTLDASVGGAGSGSNGGLLTEVQIFGNVPEPASLGLLVFGGLGMAAWNRRRPRLK